ncbi:hypothetical protein P9112_013994 [Eukaryota sp. TZLM1-RC]
MSSSNISFLLLLSFAFLTTAHTADEWKSKSIYQIITDRFAPEPDTSPRYCHDLWKYCGGTFNGITSKLQYIKSLGYDAIWISPIPENFADQYHGYAATNFYKINRYFGTAADLSNLVSTANNLGIWVMLDVVANHVSPVENDTDFSAITPFNHASHYHPLCHVQDYSNQTEVEVCRIYNLPDLDQSNPFVRETLLDWIKNVIHYFQFSGIRIDTVPHVSASFWKEFTTSAGVFSTGEVFNGDYSYVGHYQNYMDSLLNYPLYFTLKNVFGKRETMWWFRLHYENMSTNFQNLDVMVNFIDNHDNPRFLFEFPCLSCYKSALAFVFFSQGIPTGYYGSEQLYNGGQDPENREPLWYSGYKWTEMSEFIMKLNYLRKEAELHLLEQNECFINDSGYVFSRGKYLFAFTNSEDHQVMEVFNHPFSEGQLVCNYFWNSDCVTVDEGKLTVVLERGEVKVFF